MIGLFFSQLILFVVAALVGFAIGWRLHGMAHAERRGADQRETETLRTLLSEAQVKRARIS
jgi:hypothetical protein